MPEDTPNTYTVSVGDTIKIGLSDNVRSAKVVDIYRVGGLDYIKVRYGNWFTGYDSSFEAWLLKQVMQRARDLEGREHLSSIEI